MTLEKSQKTLHKRFARDKEVLSVLYIHMYIAADISFNFYTQEIIFWNIR
jgi:hypothetical protein